MKKNWIGGVYKHLFLVLFFLFFYSISFSALVLPLIFFVFVFSSVVVLKLFFLLSFFCSFLVAVSFFVSFFLFFQFYRWRIVFCWKGNLKKQVFTNIRYILPHKSFYQINPIDRYFKTLSLFVPATRPPSILSSKSG